MSEMTVGSLFSGIGGLDLGLERAGMKVIWQSEIDPYANRVLKKHWPEVVNHGNIKEINWQEVERPDVLCGGYPCQPFSTAGKRRGEEDPRHLWPWVREAIVRLRPRYAILENVRGHLTLGGLSVIGELATIGYDAEWRIVSAASVGANHRRDRIIIVAYPQSQHSNGGNYQRGDSTQPQTIPKFGNGSGTQNMANTNNTRPCSEKINSAKTGEYAFGEFGRCSKNVADSDNYGYVYAQEPWESNAWGRSAYSGFLNWQIEPDVGRVANGIPNRVDRLKGLGNAVVPQVAEVIGRLVMEHARHV